MRILLWQNKMRMRMKMRMKRTITILRLFRPSQVDIVRRTKKMKRKKRIHFLLKESIRTIMIVHI